MAKIFFKRGAVKPDTGAAANALVQTTAQQWANERVNVDLPLSTLVAQLAEHGIKVWHMPCGTTGEVLIFAGGDAHNLAKLALAAVFGKP